jgi:hypothetical protein
MTPRLATKADEPQLLALCHELHAENGLGAMNDAMVTEMLHRAFEKRGGIIGVIDGPNGIEAATVILITTIWYDDHYHLEELLLFVKPQFRHSSHHNDLIAFNQQCAKALGLPLVTGILTNEKLEAKTRLYRRKLGSPAGVIFVYNAKWSNEQTNPAVWAAMFEKDKMPRGARYVPQETLVRLGDGDADRGWAMIEKFIKRKTPKDNDNVAQLLPALTSAMMTTTPLPMLPLVVNG